LGGLIAIAAFTDRKGRRQRLKLTSGHETNGQLIKLIRIFLMALAGRQAPYVFFKREL